MANVPGNIGHLNIVKFSKWNLPTRNLEIGDLVCLHENGLVPTKWHQYGVIPSQCILVYSVSPMSGVTPQSLYPRIY